MKNFKLLLSILLFFTCLLSTAQNGSSQSLGLVSRLTEIKYGTESFFNAVMENEDLSEDEKEAVAKSYNEIRTDMNRVIYQLMADMRVKNRIRIYRRINRYYKKNGFDAAKAGKLAPYIAALSGLETKYNTFVSQSFSTTDQDGIVETFSFGDIPVADLVTAGWAIIKESSELRETKITNLATILEALMIDPIVPKEKEGTKEPKGEKAKANK